MIPNHERSPRIQEITFKKNPYTNNGYCNIFLPKYRLGNVLLKAYIILFKEFNSLEIDKKMPKLNYYKRLG